MPNDDPAQILGRIGPKSDKDLGNAEKIIFGLKIKNKRIATAESVTAGGFGVALTRVPGSSQVYVGGFVVYNRELKKLLLNIPDSILDAGLVTPELTIEMAKR
ncbi:MAG: CinA family protein, partial [bacterium]